MSIDQRLTLLDFTPFLEMSPHGLLSLLTGPNLLNPPDVQRPVLPRKRANTTHIVTVIRELLSRETVLGIIR